MLQAIATTLTSYFAGRVSGSRIDTHIHVLTPSYIKALDNNGGDPSGWATPSWTLEDCVRFSDTVGSHFSVLSVTAPGPALLGPTEAGRQLARALNDEVWAVCCQRKARFGFFASLPDFNDVDGVLAEIEHVFDQGRANGVVVMTSYGDRLVGDEAFAPIWNALNKHKALVFMHPSLVSISPPAIAGFLPQPVVDYPQATTRAAVSLILSGTLHACPDIDVILSHGGGTLPFLAQRAIGSLVDPVIASKAKVNIVQANYDLARFYYDIALSTSTPQLKALTAFAPPSKILYGSDFPYAPSLGIYTGLLQYANFVKGEEGAKMRPARLFSNAMKLLQSHRGPNSFLPSGDTEAVEPEFGLDDSEDAKRAREDLASFGTS